MMGILNIQSFEKRSSLQVARTFQRSSYLHSTSTRPWPNWKVLRHFSSLAMLKIPGLFGTYLKGSFNLIVFIITSLPLLGNSGKTLHPPNVEFHEIREISLQITITMIILVLWKRNAHEGSMMGYWVSFKFSSNMQRCANLLSTLGWLKSAKLRNHGPAEHWNHEPAKLRNHEPAKLQNRESAKFGNQQEFKSKTLPQKSGFDVWTSGRLVNVWN
jgi:hypothetical protein